MDTQEKFKSYINAAQELANKKENLHCCIVLSYYAVFMYMKFLLTNVKDNPYSHEQLRNDDNKSIHIFVREETIRRINAKDKKDLLKRIEKLHNERIKADYKEITYTTEHALEYIDFSKKIMSDLKYFYNNLL